MRCGAACAWGSQSAAALLEHISLKVIAISFVPAKKLVTVDDAPSALLRREAKYPCMLMVSGLMEN